jgi:hypothetical protein
MMWKFEVPWQSNGFLHLVQILFLVRIKLFTTLGSNLIKSTTLKDVEQHIIDCLRKNDMHAGVRLIPL